MLRFHRPSSSSLLPLAAGTRTAATAKRSTNIARLLPPSSLASTSSTSLRTTSHLNSSFFPRPFSSSSHLLSPNAAASASASASTHTSSNRFWFTSMGESATPLIHFPPSSHPPSPSPSSSSSHLPDPGCVLSGIPPGYAIRSLQSDAEVASVMPLSYGLAVSRGRASLAGEASIKVKTTPPPPSSSSSEEEISSQTRNPSDSWVSIVLPFTSQPDLRHRYQLFNTEYIRIGKILEDMDAIAGDAAYRHVSLPTYDSSSSSSSSSSSTTLDFISSVTIVTLALDRVSFVSKLDYTHDLRMQAQVSHVGKSSMEVRLEISRIENETEGQAKETPVGHAVFLMVARNKHTYAAASVPSLTLTTPIERSLFTIGAANRLRRRQSSATSLYKQPPSAEEISEVHALYLERLANTAMYEGHRTVLMQETRTHSTQLMQAQERNIHSKIFGGYLMRLAFELAWSNAYIQTKGLMPRCEYIDDIRFVHPVEIGSVVTFSSQILCTSTVKQKKDENDDGSVASLLVYVDAQVLDARTGQKKTTNEFYFRFRLLPHAALSSSAETTYPRSQIPFVLPDSYQEMIKYIDGRRREKAFREIRNGNGNDSGGGNGSDSNFDGEGKPQLRQASLTAFILTMTGVIGTIVWASEKEIEEKMKRDPELAEQIQAAEKQAIAAAVGRTTVPPTDNSNHVSSSSASSSSSSSSPSSPPSSTPSPPSTPPVYETHSGGDPVRVDSEGVIYSTNTEKPRLVILGTGWGAVSIIQGLDRNAYDITVISPRNYFLFTPLLPSATVGTLESRSLVEPIRRLLTRVNGRYFEATADYIDMERRIISCSDSANERFKVPYDLCVVAVGAKNNTFGTPGVEQYTHFLKEIQHARKIRQNILDNFERAALPSTELAEKKRLLSFVIVGGGPTGIEMAGELYDFAHSDVKIQYPELVPFVRISLVQSGSHVLNTYDEAISKYAEDTMSKQKVEIITDARVMEVKDKAVVYKDKKSKGKTTELPMGMCVWSTGIAPEAFTERLIHDIGPPYQKNSKCIVTDSRLRVQGDLCDNRLYSIGDCSTPYAPTLRDKSDKLFQMADINSDGTLSFSEFENLCKSAIEEFPIMSGHLKKLQQMFDKYDSNRDCKLDLVEFEKFLMDVDKDLKAFPATAQVAAQQGDYVAKRLNAMHRVAAKHPEGLTKLRENPDHVLLPDRWNQPFRYRHFGSLAYIGGEHAAIDLGEGRYIGGVSAFWLWKSIYLSKQVSMRTRFSLAFDWFKSYIFGRDTSEY